MTEELDVAGLLEAMKVNLRAALERRNVQDPAMVGIHTGGLWVAQRLHGLLALQHPLGCLDISFYRDDFTRIGLHPQVKPSHLPFAVDDRHIVLVDDVLQTGRTVRAALNEIFDYGRPATVILAVLVDRGERELPIHADVVGAGMTLGRGEQVKLNGPEPLTLKFLGVS
jgi:pyrimidine operon attenuation protein / uracil phosphoribosyltransferase